VQPGPVAATEIRHQPGPVSGRQIADGVDALRRQAGLRLGTDAIHLATGQRPDQGLQIGLMHHRDAVGLVEFAGHLGQQLVGRHAHRAGQAGHIKNPLLDQSRQHPAALALPTGHLGEIDVHLVHATVFHHRGDLGDLLLEQARVLAVLVKIHRQQDGLRAQPGRLHQPHGRTHTELSRGIGRGRDHAPPGVARQAGKRFERQGGTRRQHGILLAAPATDHHGQPLELRIAQQLDRRIKRIHVQVRNAAHRWEQRGRLVHDSQA